VNTYETAADAEADRAQQLRLLAALGAWDRALRRDELAAWCITGTRGRIYTAGDGKTWVKAVGGAMRFLCECRDIKIQIDGKRVYCVDCRLAYPEPAPEPIELEPAPAAPAAYLCDLGSALAFRRRTPLTGSNATVSPFAIAS
jgi:hypothetical protein